LYSNQNKNGGSFVGNRCSLELQLPRTVSKDGCTASKNRFLEEQEQSNDVKVGEKEELLASL